MYLVLFKLTNWIKLDLFCGLQADKTVKRLLPFFMEVPRLLSSERKVFSVDLRMLYTQVTKFFSKQNEKKNNYSLF